MNILTTDPSLAEFGLAIIDRNDGNAIHGECIKTKKQGDSVTTDRARRFEKIAQRLNEVITEYNINKWVSEIPHGSQSASSAWALGGVCGVCASTSTHLKLNIEWISQFKIKQELFDTRSVEKEKMVTEMKNRYNTDVFGEFKYEQQAISDSLGVWEAYQSINNSDTDE